MDLGMWFQVAALIGTLVPTAGLGYPMVLLLASHALLLLVQASKEDLVEDATRLASIVSLSAGVCFAYEYYLCEGMCLKESWNGVHGFWVGLSLAVMESGFNVKDDDIRALAVLGAQLLALLVLAATTSTDLYGDGGPDVVPIYVATLQVTAWALYATLDDNLRPYVVRASTAMCAIMASVALVNASAPLHDIIQGVIVAFVLLLIAGSNQCLPFPAEPAPADEEEEVVTRARSDAKADEQQFRVNFPRRQRKLETNGDFYADVVNEHVSESGQDVGESSLVRRRRVPRL